MGERCGLPEVVSLLCFFLPPLFSLLAFFGCYELDERERLKQALTTAARLPNEHSDEYTIDPHCRDQPPPGPGQAYISQFADEMGMDPQSGH